MFPPPEPPIEPLKVMFEMAEVRLSARCVYWGDWPVENVMSSTGS